MLSLAREPFGSGANLVLFFREPCGSVRQEGCELSLFFFAEIIIHADCRKGKLLF